MPICSSACDSLEKPPSPTQKAEYDGLPVVQETLGWTQEPVTSVKDVGAPDVFVPLTAYPAQFDETTVSAPRRGANRRPEEASATLDAASASVPSATSAAVTRSTRGR